MFNRFCFGALLLAGLAVPLTGCNNSSSGLDSISISPNTDLQLVVGNPATIQLTVTGTFGNGKHPTTGSVANVSWASAIPLVAKVSSSGVVSAVSAGTATITATAQGYNGPVTASVQVTVVQGTTSGGGGDIVSIAITPSTQSVNATGQTSQFIAIGTNASGATSNLTGDVVWSSSSTSIATICNAVDPGPISPAPCSGSTVGLATAVSQGTSTITALYTNTDKTTATGTATFTVTAQATTEPLVSLAVSPATQTVQVGNTVASFIAIGTTGTGTTVNLTDPSKYVVPGTSPAETIQWAQWSSSNPAVATIDPNTGIINAKAAGATAITAIAINPDNTIVNGSAVLTVSAASTAEPLLSVSVLPNTPPPSLSVAGQTVQLIAIGTFSSVPITQDVTAGLVNPAIATSWSSSNTGVATVTTACPTGLTAKSCAISICPPGSTGTACTTCPAPAVPAGASCATLNPTTPIGLVTGVGQGTAVIMAVSSNPDTSLVTAMVPVTVVSGAAEQYTALEVLPNTQAATAPAQQTQFIALATSSTTGLQYDVTDSDSVSWTSTNATVATVCSYDALANCSSQTSPAFGQVTAKGTGTTNITATWKSTVDSSVLVAQATYTVTIGAAQEPLISIQVVPNNITVWDKGQTQQYLAIGTFSTTPTLQDITDGISRVGFAGCTVAPCTTVSPVTWITLDPNLVSIDSSGTNGEIGGLAEAMGYSGSGVLYIEATNPDGTVVLSNPATFTCADPNDNNICNPLLAPTLLATLTVFNAGSNSTNWLITAPSDTGTLDLIHCGPGSALAGLGNSVCTGTYATGSPVTLTANLVSPTGKILPIDDTFGGWTANCDATPNTPVLTDQCLFPNAASTTGLDGDQSVGALFYGLSLSCSSNTSGTVGVPFNSGALTVSNGTSPYTFSVVGTLPAGLTLNPSTNTITGTVTLTVTGTPTAAGSFSPTVADANGAVAETACGITIAQ